MVFLSEEEAEIRFFEHLQGQLRILLDIDAQRFQAVCRAAQGRRSPVAVLGDFDTACGQDHGRRRGNVEGMSAVAAGADDFQDINTRMGNGCSQGAHGFGTAGNFIDRFSFGALRRKGCQERRILRRRRFALHDFHHDLMGFVIGQITFIYNLDNRFFNHCKYLPC